MAMPKACSLLQPILNTDKECLTEKMIGKEKSNQRNVKKQMTEASYKLVEHCQLRKIQGWRQMKTVHITKVFSLSLFPEGHDISTY